MQMPKRRLTAHPREMIIRYEPIKEETDMLGRARLETVALTLITLAVIYRAGYRNWIEG